MKLNNGVEVPDVGYHCVRVTDLGVQSHVCEFCGKQKCRYVYEMKHPELHPDFFLLVGYVCAQKMVPITSGRLSPNGRDLVEFQDRLANSRPINDIIDMDTWNMSKKGNLYKYVLNWTVTIFPATKRDKEFNFCLFDGAAKERIYSNKSYATQLDAAQVALKRVIHEQNERIKNRFNYAPEGWPKHG